MRPTSLLFALSCLTACASPPVWRAAQYGPAQPTPTLAAASVCNFTIPEPPDQEVTIDATDASFSFSDLAKGIGNYVKDNPEVLANLAAEIALKEAAKANAAAAIGAAAAAMHGEAMAFLQGQGFPTEIDGARAKKLMSDGMVPGQFVWVAMGTAARPFDSFPMFGPVRAAFAAALQGMAKPVIQS